MPMPTPMSASVVTSSPLRQLPQSPLLLLLSPRQLALLPQSVSAKRCQWRAPTRLLARFASQSHNKFAPTLRSLCPGKFAPSLLSPSPLPPLPLLLLPSPLLHLLSLSLALVLGLGGLLE